jgi:malate/lactate dehydrogenase
MNSAQKIGAAKFDASRWFAMTRLDENRAKSQLAKKAGVDVTAVTNVAIWGKPFRHAVSGLHECARSTDGRRPI